MIAESLPSPLTSKTTTSAPAAKSPGLPSGCVPTVKYRASLCKTRTRPLLQHPLAATTRSAKAATCPTLSAASTRTSAPAAVPALLWGGVVVSFWGLLCG